MCSSDLRLYIHNIRQWIIFCRKFFFFTFQHLVSPEGFTLSSKAVKSEETVSNRKLRQGYGTMKEKDNGAGDTIFFNLYLIDKFGNAAKRKRIRYWTMRWSIC